MKYTNNLLLVLVIIIELGIIIFLKQKNDYLDNMHKIVISNIMEHSFKLGCLRGSDTNIFLCEQMTRDFKLNDIPNLELE
jgi:hypothetical protein